MRISEFSLSPDNITEYCESVTSCEPEVCRVIREHARNHPKRHWTTGPLVGTFLQITAVAISAKRTLDLGTFFGYSSAYLASATEKNQVTTIDASKENSQTARSLISNYPIAKQIDFIVADAGEWIAKYDEALFDLIFFDSNRNDVDKMLPKLLNMLRVGGVLLMDNACLQGKVLAPKRNWEISTNVVNHFLSSTPNMITTVVPVRDGLVYSIKTE